MPPPRTGEAAHRHRIIRRVLAVRGQMRLVVDAAPRFDYARGRHEVALTQHGALFRPRELVLSPSARCPLQIVDGDDVRARIAVRAGETATFALDRVEPGEMPAACLRVARKPSSGDERGGLTGRRAHDRGPAIVSHGPAMTRLP